MKKVLVVLVTLLALNTTSAQTYKVKGASSLGFILTDSTITSTKNGNIIALTKGFRKEVESEGFSLKVTEYYQKDEEGNEQKWHVVEMDKNNIHIVIITTNRITGDKTYSSLLTKRI